MKRTFDLAIAIVGLALLLPIMLVVAIGVWATIGRPVLFSQQRPGLNGVPFRMRKFRTMIESFDDGGIPAPDEKRMTRFGQRLRASSLDELPELWNVLAGHMSLVGPRPLLPEYLPLYSAAQRRRHEVRPGITGWAQVNGRNAVSWDQRLAMDVWYVDNASFLLDLKILWMTVCKVVKREGIAQDGHASMPRFTGSGAKSDGG